LLDLEWYLFLFFNGKTECFKWKLRVYTLFGQFNWLLILKII
jgi:hypothetical protein